jgi:23S rRNA pseudouridine1911/1915/1917 synthase
MKHIGHPLFNDLEYGGDRILKGTSFTKYKQFVENCFLLLTGQALHAKTLGFEHPLTKEYLRFDSELPSSMKNVLEKWETYMSARNSD